MIPDFVETSRSTAQVLHIEPGGTHPHSRGADVFVAYKNGTQWLTFDEIEGDARGTLVVGTKIDRVEGLHHRGNALWSPTARWALRGPSSQAAPPKKAAPSTPAAPARTLRQEAKGILRSAARSLLEAALSRLA